jgi:hypothetical protein
MSRVWATNEGDAIPTERQLPAATTCQKSGKNISPSDHKILQVTDIYSINNKIPASSADLASLLH